MGNRYLDWFRQAEADLQHARNAYQTKEFEWCCFAAQQAAEKALKAVFQKRGMDAWGHTLTVLIGNLPPDLKAPDNLVWLLGWRLANPCQRRRSVSDFS